MLVRRYNSPRGTSLLGGLPKDFPLASGEQIEFSALIRQKMRWGSPLRRLWLTSLRAFLYEHHFFSSDRMLEIPRESLANVEWDDLHPKQGVTLTYSSEAGPETIRLSAGKLRGQPPLSATLLLVDALRAFRDGELNRATIERAADRRKLSAGRLRW